MVYFIIYKLGQILSISLPIKISYWFAERIAEIHYFISRKDRRSMISNLMVVLNNDEEKAYCYAKESFKNFGRYLVDFFRVDKIDKNLIERNVKVEGLENMNKALRAGKGVIALTAHLGNWELGGIVMSILGYPINAIAWTHKNKLVNDFFVKRRTDKGVKVIPVGPGIRKCFSCLAKGEIVALLGDIDFPNPNYGIKANFFGKEALVPKGPAALSLKAGAPIVPGFMVRVAGDKFKLIFEPEIQYIPTGDFEKDLKNLTGKFLKVIETYIEKYSFQWFMATEIWKPVN